MNRTLLKAKDDRSNRFPLMYDANKELALRSWLAAGASNYKNLPDLCEEIGKRLKSTGLKVDQFAIYVRMIHAAMPGKYVYWTETTGARLYTFTPEQLQSPNVWIGCAAQRCAESHRMIVHTFGCSADFDKRPKTPDFHVVWPELPAQRMPRDATAIRLVNT